MQAFYKNQVAANEEYFKLVTSIRLKMLPQKLSTYRWLTARHLSLFWYKTSLDGFPYHYQVFSCYVQANIYPNECCLVTQTSSQALRLNQVSGVLWRALSLSFSAVLYAFPGHRHTVWSWQCQQAACPLQTPELSSDIDTVALPEGAGLARDWLCVCAPMREY